MDGAFEKISDMEIHDLFETDYFAAVNVTKAVLLIMHAQKIESIAERLC